MTIGTWEPKPAQDHPTLAMLLAALAYTDVDSFPESAPAQVEPLKAFVNQPYKSWQPVLAELPTEHLKPLCYFFTLAEANWSDWFGGDKNPVIWLCKELKKHDQFPDKELTLWIKQHTENRFLPYGNVFG